MRITVLLIGSLFLLAGCANYWPGDDVTPEGHNFADDAIRARFNDASPKNLGTAEDAKVIKQILWKHDPGCKINEIRWLSPTRVLAGTEEGRPQEEGRPHFRTYAAFYCALEKNDKGWHLITTYLGTVE